MTKIKIETKKRKRPSWDDQFIIHRTHYKTQSIIIPNPLRGEETVGKKIRICNVLCYDKKVGEKPEPYIYLAEEENESLLISCLTQSKLKEIAKWIVNGMVPFSKPIHSNGYKPKIIYEPTETWSINLLDGLFGRPFVLSNTMCFYSPLKPRQIKILEKWMDKHQKNYGKYIK